MVSFAYGYFVFTLSLGIFENIKYKSLSGGASANRYGTQ